MESHAAFTKRATIGLLRQRIRRMEEEKERNDQHFALLFIIERKRQRDTRDRIDELEVITNELKRQNKRLRHAAARKPVKRKLKFDE